MNQLPHNVKIMSLIRRAPSTSKKNKGKQICEHELAGSDKNKDTLSENALATLDIFAGCGGLSEGLQLSGMHFLCMWVDGNTLTTTFVYFLTIQFCRSITNKVGN